MDEVFVREQPSPAHSHTGERLSYGHSLQTEVEHFHRYYLARQMAHGLDVLDIACGEGYGSAVLAQVARSVVGVDLDEEAIAHARRTYVRNGLDFRQGSATDIPLADASVDLLVSFETLEHFTDHDAFFRSARRVLRPGGRLIISTPDREIYSPPAAEPNPYHLRELSSNEFQDLVRRFFPDCAFFSQQALVGSAILRDDAEQARPWLVFQRHGSSQVEASAGLTRPPYLICIAGGGQAGPLPDSLFIETSELARFTDRIPWLEREVRERVAIQEAAQRAQAEAEATANAAALQIREQAAGLEELRAHRVELRRAVAQQAAELEDLRRDAAADTVDLEELRVQCVELRRAVAQQAVELNLLREGTLERNGQAALLRLDLARREAEAAHLREELALRLAQYQRIAGSTLWRLLSPVRRMAERFPGPARMARRIARLLWLAATLRLHRRLALRRQRQAEIALLAGSPLFDRGWYRAAYPEAAGTDPVAHYVWGGAEAGFDPHPLFDTDWYLQRHPELAASGTNPLVHFLREGAARGEDPHPLFDTAYYLAQAPEAAAGGAPALLHYMARPRSDLRSAVPFFDPAGYLMEHAAARQSGLDPLVHYARHGVAAALDPHPLFDTAWYLASCPEARDSHLSPLAHFLREGAARGYRPSPLLDPDEPLLPLRALSFATAQDADKAPDVTIIVPAYGHYFETARCLRALMRRSGGELRTEIILVDDRPSEPIAPLFAGVSGLRVVVNPRNLGFVRSCNAAARLAAGRHLVFLNNDTIVHQDWLAPMVRLADSDASIGMVGAKLLNTDGTVQEAGGAIFSDGWGRPYGRGEDPSDPAYNFVREVDCVIGACFLVSRDAFRAVGGLDDRYAPAFYEEFDLAFALRAAGRRVMYQPASVVTHLDAASYGTAIRDAQSTKNHALFCRKWATELASQPRPGSSPFIWRERPHPGGTILMLEDRVPEYDKHAGAQATRQYIRLLMSLGLKVVYWPYDGQVPQPYTAQMQQDGVEVLHLPVRLPDWLRENGRHVDYVWAARPYVTSSVLEAILRETGAPIIYLTHDLHYLREERRYEVDGDQQALTEAREFKRIELGMFRTADTVLTFSEDEAAVIRREVPEAVVRTAPLFFYHASPDPADSPAGRTDLLFVGGFRHAPNVDAAVWLVREIMPLVWREVPEARVAIVGSDPPPEVGALHGERVEVAGQVPDLSGHYARARVSINPLRFGAGVKGKIVNSLAMGLPVVTTGVGNEGLNLRNGVEALVGDTPTQIADHIISLYRDHALWRSLSQAGAAVIGRCFSERSARELVQELLGLRICPVCGHLARGLTDAQRSNWHQAIGCEACYALTRTQSLAEVLLRLHRREDGASLADALPALAELDIHEFGNHGALAALFCALPRFSCSDYIDDVAPGATGPDGIVCQDLQQLTYADGTFDLLISQDVFEHVPDPEGGFREVLRVLRPGGRHIFTVPYDPGLPCSVTRARVTPSGVEHLLPAVYHRDPERHEGALVFTEFGADLPGLLRRIGFEVVLHETCMPNVGNGGLTVFETTRPGAASPPDRDEGPMP